MENRPCLLSNLFQYKADLFKIEEETGIKITAALFEIDRQIKQCVQHDNSLKGTSIIEPTKED